MGKAMPPYPPSARRKRARTTVRQPDAVPARFVMPGRSKPLQEEPDLVFEQDANSAYVYRPSIPTSWKKTGVNGSKPSKAEGD